MRTLTLALLLLQPTILFAATDKPNPADFTLKIHVVSSAAQMQVADKGISYFQVLETIIDTTPVQLQGYSQGVLALGDYPARLAKKIFVHGHPNTYDIYRGYDLLLPDGTTRTYTVTRLGPAPATNP